MHRSNRSDRPSTSSSKLEFETIVLNSDSETDHENSSISAKKRKVNNDGDRIASVENPTKRSKPLHIGKFSEQEKRQVLEYINDKNNLFKEGNEIKVDWSNIKNMNRSIVQLRSHLRNNLNGAANAIKIDKELICERPVVKKKSKVIYNCGGFSADEIRLLKEYVNNFDHLYLSGEKLKVNWSFNKVINRSKRQMCKRLKKIGGIQSVVDQAILNRLNQQLDDKKNSSIVKVMKLPPKIAASTFIGPEIRQEIADTEYNKFTSSEVKQLFELMTTKKQLIDLDYYNLLEGRKFDQIVKKFNFDRNEMSKKNYPCFYFNRCLKAFDNKQDYEQHLFNHHQNPHLENDHLNQVFSLKPTTEEFKKSVQNIVDAFNRTVYDVKSKLSNSKGDKTTYAHLRLPYSLIQDGSMLFIESDIDCSFNRKNNQDKKLDKLDKIIEQKSKNKVQLENQQIKLSLNELEALITYIGEGYEDTRDLLSFVEVIIHSELNLSPSKKQIAQMDDLKNGIVLISKMATSINKGLSMINESCLLLDQDLFKNIGNTQNHSIDIHMLNLVPDLRIVSSYNLHQLVKNLNENNFYIITLDTAIAIKNAIQADIDFLKTNLDHLNSNPNKQNANKDVRRYVHDFLGQNRKIIFKKATDVINEKGYKLKLVIDTQTNERSRMVTQNNVQNEIGLYKCLDPNCKREYTDPGQMVKHIINVHNSVKCILCDAEYCQTSFVARHYFEHHEEEKLKCRINGCKRENFKYHNLERFRRHMLQAHEINYEFDI